MGIPVVDHQRLVEVLGEIDVPERIPPALHGQGIRAEEVHPGLTDRDNPVVRGQFGDVLPCGLQVRPAMFGIDPGASLGCRATAATTCAQSCAIRTASRELATSTPT